jgi:hypothetical protein
MIHPSSSEQQREVFTLSMCFSGFRRTFASSAIDVINAMGNDTTGALFRPWHGVTTSLFRDGYPSILERHRCPAYNFLHTF